MPSVGFKPPSPSKQAAVVLYCRQHGHNYWLSSVLPPCHYGTLTELSDKPTE